MEERVDSTRTGFQIFENFVWAAPVNISDNQVSLPSFFNDTVDTFKKSIKGFLRIILDAIKLYDGNVPILNVINSSSPIIVENIKALVGAVGIPFINTQERGCFFHLWIIVELLM